MFWQSRVNTFRRTTNVTVKDYRLLLIVCSIKDTCSVSRTRDPPGHPNNTPVSFPHRRRGTCQYRTTEGHANTEQQQSRLVWHLWLIIYTDHNVWIDIKACSVAKKKGILQRISFTCITTTPWQYTTVTKPHISGSLQKWHFLKFWPTWESNFE